MKYLEFYEKVELPLNGSSLELESTAVEQEKKVLNHINLLRMYLNYKVDY